MIRSLDDLQPAARAVADDYLREAAARLPVRQRGPVLDDLTTALCTRLEADSGPAVVAELVAEFGPVVPAGNSWGERLRRIAGGLRLTGVGERVASTWWNPADERLLLPRALGTGWDLNLGAVAVRLGLIEPDAEAEPFAATPDGAFRAAALVPTALAAATALHYAVRGRALPARLPTHWTVAGAPDRWVSLPRAAATDLAGTLVPAGFALAAARSSRPGPDRAGTIAVATAVGSVTAWVAVWRSLGDRPRPWAGPATVVVMTGAVGTVLYGLARAGRAAELSRDLGSDAATAPVTKSPPGFIEVHPPFTGGRGRG